MKTRPTSFETRYGVVVRSYGIAAIPASLFRFQGQLGITPAETWLVSVLLSYRWTREAPYPSLSRLSRESGIARSTIQTYVTSLRQKGLIDVEHRLAPDRGLASNAYHLEPLLEKLAELIENEETDGGGTLIHISEGVSGPPATPVRPPVHPIPTGRQEVDSPEEDSLEEDSPGQRSLFGSGAVNSALARLIPPGSPDWPKWWPRIWTAVNHSWGGTEDELAQLIHTIAATGQRGAEGIQQLLDELNNHAMMGETRRDSASQL